MRPRDAIEGLLIQNDYGVCRRIQGFNIAALNWAPIFMPRLFNQVRDNEHNGKKFHIEIFEGIKYENIKWAHDVRTGGKCTILFND